MKRAFYLIITFLLIVTNLLSQDKRDANWIEDIDYIINRIQIIHPNMYLNISEREFEENALHLKEKVPALSDSEVLLGITELIASIGDGHTNFDLFESKPLLMNKYFKSFPITIYPFDDGFYIIAAAKKYEESVGKRVIKIGDMPIEEAAKKVSRIIHADNNYGVLQLLPYVLNMAEVLKYCGVTNTISELTLELENDEGELEVVKFDSKPTMTNLLTLYRGPIPTVSDNKHVTMNRNCSSPLPLWLSQCPKKFSEKANKYWFINLAERNTYYLQINVMENKPEENFKDFLNRMFIEFDENKAGKLIVDIRLNDGGANIGQELLDKIVARPELNKSENLFLLISRVTYSASQHLTNLITNYTNATLIGEPTSSKPNFFGSYLRFSPPNNDGLVFRCSSKYFQGAGPDNFELATKPDLYVPYNAEHYKNNIDPVLERVFTYEANNYSDFIEKLKKAYIDGDINGMKNEYKKLNSDIMESGIDPEHILLNEFDMWMVLNRQTDEKYIEYLEFLIQEFPNNYTVFYWLADWQRPRNPEKAKECFERCLEINPAHLSAKMSYELMLLDESYE